MKNEKLILTVTDIGSEGEGIARREDGYTLFVPGALPGDRAEILVLKENRSYGYGKLLRVLEPSPHRVEAACPVFGKCGGCTMLAAAYGFQLEMKTRRVKDALERIGGLASPRVLPCVGSEPFLGYRNKAQYPAAELGGGLTVGFYAPHSHRVVPNSGCALQKPLITEIVNFAAAEAARLKIKAYDEESGGGTLRHICVRAGEAEAVAVLVAARDDKLFDKLAASLAARFPSLVGVVLNLNPRKTNLILGEKQRILFGRDYIIDKIGDVSYKIHYKSFYQINPSTTKKLYDKAAEYCALTGGETVFDLYCGVGTIGLYLARGAKKVVGVEVVPEAVENARENARLNGIENASFICGRAEEVCPRLRESGERADIIVLDPPRKGCGEELLRAAAGMAPERIVYISCNPATLARDCKLLAALGYSLAEATPFDQFCQTAHVEAAALLIKTK